MLNRETIGFIRRIPPFTLLSEEQLTHLAACTATEYFPRGARILTRGGPPSEFLHVIKKGGVKVLMGGGDGNDQDRLEDMRGEGEIFGALSVLSGDRSRADVVAVDDTICYLVPAAEIHALQQADPAIGRYFLTSFLAHFIDNTHAEIRKKYTGLTGGDRLLFTVPVGSLVRRAPVTTPGGATIQEAAAIMVRERISSIVVLDGAGKPAGLVTDRDLRAKVVAAGIDITAPVQKVMSAPLVAIEADRPCFEALLSMVRNHIHHLLVMEQGRFTGVLTNHDFMLLQGSSPTALVKDLEKAKNIEELVAAVRRVRKAVAGLLREGAKAAHVSSFLTEFAEKLVTVGFARMEAEQGPAPLPYTVFFLDRGGRRELTLEMDFSGGIVHDPPSTAEEGRIADAYFR